ncbi:hypothetical protein As57867_006562, partial [Aphanomyces stellatus]
AASQCCFKDGESIFLKADTGKFLGRCNNCVLPRAAYPDSAFVHVTNPQASPWAEWKVYNTGDGKIVLKADTNNYLARCNNCAPGAAYPDEAFVHVNDWHGKPWAQWSCVDVGGGKVALQSDSGHFLARCNNCVKSIYPDSGFVHPPTSTVGSWAQWTIVS